MKQQLRQVTDKIVSQQAYDLLAKEVFTVLKEKANKIHTHSADDITDGSNKKIPTIAKQTEWDNKVDEAKLQEELKKVVSGLSWKGVFTTLEELKKQITEPKEGDFVIVTQEPTYKNKNTLLIYEAETVNDWQTAGDLFIPSKVTHDSDGLMSKEDKVKLDGITNDKLLTTELKTKYDKASTDATSALQKATSVEASLKSKVDNTIEIVAGNGITGGGALNANVNISIASGNDGITVGADNITLETIDNLISTSPTKPLSANQGKALKDSLDSTTTKLTSVEEKLTNVLSVEEAQEIVNKYKV